MPVCVSLTRKVSLENNTAAASRGVKIHADMAGNLPPAHRQANFNDGLNLKLSAVGKLHAYSGQRELLGLARRRRH